MDGVVKFVMWGGFRRGSRGCGQGRQARYCNHRLPCSGLSRRLGEVAMLAGLMSKEAHDKPNSMVNKNLSVAKSICLQEIKEKLN